jgi:BirA family biotin operon repressor/biotin-[acetyl-CoA-carboxylase] ligase
MMPVEQIRSSLRTRVVGHRLHTFDVVDSTNNVARNLADEGAPEGTTVLAEYQTAGRGRLNRTWHSEPGKNLLASIILRPRKLGEVRMLPYVTSLSAAEAVEELTGLYVECKWPNDLLINGKKFGGMLLESSLQKSRIEYVVVGIGMNINQQHFPLALRDAATSLRIECEREFERIHILAGLLERFERNYFTGREDRYSQVRAKWTGRCTMFGKDILVRESGRQISGRAVRVDRDGALVLQNHRLRVRVFAGEATVVNEKVSGTADPSRI